MGNRLSNDKWEKLGINPETLQMMDPEKRDFFWACMEEYIRIVEIFHSKETQEYFHNLVAAFMIQYNKENPNDEIKVYYRIKSCKSIFDKLVDYFSRDEWDGQIPRCVYGEDPENPRKPKLFQEISDIFGMTIVYGKGEDLYYSENKPIQILIDEKIRNTALIQPMQRFKITNTKNEFTSSQNQQYLYKDTRKRYYLYCILLIEKIKSLIDPKATKLLEKYNQILRKIEQVVPKSFFEAVKEVISDSSVFQTLDPLKDIESKVESLCSELGMSDEEEKKLEESFSDEDVRVVSFCKLYNDFINRIPDKLDLAILNKRFVSLFENDETLGILRMYEIKFLRYSLKEKREENGYVSNFYRIRTPFGDVEVQLQPKHEYEEACRGYSAHSEMKGKNISLEPIPELDDEKGLKEFRDWAKFISAKKSVATFTPEVQGRVSTAIPGKYENLMLLLTQVEDGNPISDVITRYCAEMYEIRERLFPEEHEEDRTEGRTEKDVREYGEQQSWKTFLIEKRRVIEEMHKLMGKKVNSDEERGVE